MIFLGIYKSSLSIKWYTEKKSSAEGTCKCVDVYFTRNDRTYSLDIIQEFKVYHDILYFQKHIVNEGFVISLENIIA